MNLALEQLKNTREYISKCIAQSYTNWRLSPLHTMLEQSHCTRMALEYVIKEYDVGYLIRKNRSGFYLRSQSPNGNAIELVACHDEGYSAFGFLYECLLAMINIFSKHGYSMRLNYKVATTFVFLQKHNLVTAVP